MTYNPETLECICDRCLHIWRNRTDTPKKCPSCSSLHWNAGTRRFQYILARACGTDPNTGYRKFCILPELTNPETMTDDVFAIDPEKNAYIKKIRTPNGSALLFIGDFEIGQDELLTTRDLKLLYVHESFMRSYNSLRLVYQKPKH